MARIVLVLAILGCAAPAFAVPVDPTPVKTNTGTALTVQGADGGIPIPVLVTGAGGAQPVIGVDGGYPVKVDQGQAGASAWKVDGSGVTQPVSAASLPLPAGAATSANQTTLGSQTTKVNDGTNTAAVKAASTAPLATDPALVVTISPNSGSLSNPSVSATGASPPAQATYVGTKDSSGNLAGLNLNASGALKTDASATTQPVSAASLPLPTGASTAAKQPALGTAGSPSSDVITVQGVSTGTSLPISGTVTATVSGVATSSNQTTLGSQTTKINDGTNTAAVKAASTAPIATDPALVVSISPNSPASSVSGTVTANQGTPNSTANAWPHKITDGTNTASVTASSALKVDGSAVTQPVSAASLPLPTGAATSANQTTLGNQTTKINDGTNTASVSAANALKVDGSAVTQPVSAASLPLPSGAATSSNQTTLGNQTTKINDGTNTAAVKAASTAPLATDPSLVVTISPNSPASAVSGTVTANQGTPNSTANAWPHKITDGTNTASVTASSALKVDGSAVTQPVSAASLPLPSGAATSANQTTLGNQTSKINDGTNTAAVKAASTAAGATDPALVVAVSPNNTVTVSGTVTANAGTNLNTSALATSSNQTNGTQQSKVTDGTNVAAVKAASTAPIATDPSLVVTISPNSPAITASNPSVSATGSAPPASATYVGGSVTTAAPAYTNGQMSGLSLTTAGAARVDGSGVTQPVSGSVTATQATGSNLHVVVDTAPTTAVTQSGTFTVQPGNTANTTPWLASNNDGTNTQAVKGASTAAVAADKAAVVVLSPNSPITVADTAPAAQTLGALNATCAVTLAGNNSAGFIIPTSSTLAGTLIPEVSYDNSNWVATSLVDNITEARTLTQVSVSGTQYTKAIVLVGGARFARIRVNPYTSGTAQCSVAATAVDMNRMIVQGPAADGVTLDLTNNKPVVVGFNDANGLVAPANTDANGNIKVGGAASGSNAAIVGAPVLMGVEVNSGQPAAASTGNQRQVLGALDGAIYTRTGGPVLWHCSLTGVAASLTQCQAAPAAGLSLYITAVFIQTTTATSGTYAVQSGTGSNCVTGTAAVFPASGTANRFTAPINTSGLQQVDFLTPIKVTAANALCLIGTATNTIDIEALGFTAP